jgi:putative RNA 2'-phosphotransferase
MSRSTDNRISRLLSLALRHDPGALGLTLDAQGYVEVADVLRGLSSRGKTCSREDLDHVVATNDKRRFAYSADGTKIRASQGHSVDVDLGYAPAEPPAVLYHGTAMRNEDSIRSQGILKGQRQHVHLSVDKVTALQVGSRHGTACVMTVDAARMHRDGHRFYLAANGVWLADHVPVTYLTVRS